MPKYEGSYIQVYNIEAANAEEAADILGDIRGTIPADYEFTVVDQAEPF